MLQQQKLLNQQISRSVNSEVEAAAAETDSDDSAATLSKPPSVSSASPPRPPTNATNLDRLVEAVTPFVPALCPSEVVKELGFPIIEDTLNMCLFDEKMSAKKGN